MIFKKADSKQKQLNTLKMLLQQSTSDKQKALIQKDLNILQSGIKAEQQNAYYIDFHLKDNTNLIVLHDIRLEHNDRTAQIDHMIITRFGIELLESKSFKGKLTINEDYSLEIDNNGKVQTYPNPLEQSKRHAKVVEEFLKDKANLSKRIDFFGGWEISSRVLIHPETTITNKKLPEDFVRADTFLSKRNEEVDKMGVLQVFKLLGKITTIDTAKEVAQLLIDAHTPIDFNYEAKYKVPQQNTITEPSHTIEEELKKEKLEAGKQTSVNDKLKEGDPCPFCSSKLVLRKGKNESYFLGCSSFPKCRFTRILGKNYIGISPIN